MVLYMAGGWWWTDTCLYCQTDIPVLSSLATVQWLEGMLEGLLRSLLDSLLGTVLHPMLESLLESHHQSQLNRATFDRTVCGRAVLQEECSFPQFAFGWWNTLSLWKLWVIEGTRPEEAVASRRLEICRSFDADVDSVNLLVPALLVLWSPSPTPLQLPLPLLLLLLSSPSTPDWMCTHMPNIEGTWAQDSAAKAGMTICSPYDQIVNHSCGI